MSDSQSSTPSPYQPVPGEHIDQSLVKTSTNPTTTSCKWTPGEPINQFHNLLAWNTVLQAGASKTPKFLNWVQRRQGCLRALGSTMWFTSSVTAYEIGRSCPHVLSDATVQGHSFEVSSWAVPVDSSKNGLVHLVDSTDEPLKIVRSVGGPTPTSHLDEDTSEGPAILEYAISTRNRQHLGNMMWCVWDTVRPSLNLDYCQSKRNLRQVLERVTVRNDEHEPESCSVGSWTDWRVVGRLEVDLEANRDDTLRWDISSNAR
ncbi:hypothetical protein Sjap_011308 [Stephania japonica]|uniref:Uncharacterized protein n=1 Tax=Stephania japonica TaxID=461633 RepID=A0AAP0JB53_9MAGN